jgi:hypothetical protein
MSSCVGVRCAISDTCVSFDSRDSHGRSGCGGRLAHNRANAPATPTTSNTTLSSRTTTKNSERDELDLERLLRRGRREPRERSGSVGTRKQLLIRERALDHRAQFRHR